MKRTLSILALVLLIGAPSLAAAHEISLPFWGSPLLSCTAQDDPSLPGTAVKEVCNDFCDIVHTGQHLLYFAITILVFVVVPVSFLAGGIMWMFSRGSTELVAAGTKMMRGAVMGLVIVLVAFIVVNTVLTSIGRRGEAEGGPSVAWGTIECSTNAPNSP